MSGSDEFFVGYAPVPPMLRRFLTGLLALLFGGLFGAGIGFALSQPSQGGGKWSDLGEWSVTGRLAASDLPLLVDAEGHAVLLVGVWKHGAQTDLTAASVPPDATVTARGYALERDGLTVLQLDGPPVVAGLSQNKPPEPVWSEAPVTDLEGEIVDAKCWAGAMVPGDGKPHQACGSLCLRGGIPALFVPAGVRQPRAYLILTDGRSISGTERLRSAIGRRVRVAGRLGRIGELPVIDLAGATPKLL